MVIATNIHEEAMDDHVNDAFADYGTIKNMQFNLDHRTGYAKVWRCPVLQIDRAPCTRKEKREGLKRGAETAAPCCVVLAIRCHPRFR